MLISDISVWDIYCRLTNHSIIGECVFKRWKQVANVDETVRISSCCCCREGKWWEWGNQRLTCTRLNWCKVASDTYIQVGTDEPASSTACLSLYTYMYICMYMCVATCQLTSTCSCRFPTKCFVARTHRMATCSSPPAKVWVLIAVFYIYEYALDPVSFSLVVYVSVPEW